MILLYQKQVSYYFFLRIYINIYEFVFCNSKAPIKSILNCKPNNNGLINSVICPSCKQLTGAAKFALHLEKCLKGGIRNNKRIFGETEQNSKRFDFPDVLPPRASRLPPIDPYPESLVIKIKLKDGKPYRNLFRLGVSMEDFNNTITETVNETECNNIQNISNESN